MPMQGGQGGGFTINQENAGGIITGLAALKGSVRESVFGIIDTKYKDKPKTAQRLKGAYSFGTADSAILFPTDRANNQGIAQPQLTIDTRSPMQRWFETYGFFTLIAVVVVGALVYALRIVTPQTRTRSTGTRRRSTTTTRTSGRTVKKKVSSNAKRLPKRPKKGEANYKEKMSKYMRALRNRKS